MSASASAWFMILLNIIMIFYTYWILSLNNSPHRFTVTATLFGWLILLHFGLSAQSIFTQNISGIMFLFIIVLFVFIVGLVLLLISPIRKLLFNLTQSQLLLLQGIRIAYGASFLMFASLGNMPLLFGIIDGWMHISAGFFALIAVFLVTNPNKSYALAWFANLFGLLDILIVATTLSLVILAEITPHGSMMYAVFLPAPLWLWFHLVSIHKLIKQ